MAIVKQAIKYGGLAYAAKSLGKAAVSIHSNHQSSPQPNQQHQQAYYSQQPPAYNANPGYVHQPYCNGTCGNVCSNPK
jgi:hypothetical protein